MTIVLVDSCSFHFYRVTATYSWYRRRYADQAFDPDRFTQHLFSQYDSCLDKLCKRLGCHVSQMYLIRDCPRDQIWRNKFLPSYKANRSAPDQVTPEQPDKFRPGPFIKQLNSHMSERFKQVLRVEQAEADDVMAVLVHLFSTVYPGRPIHLVATDSDYNQLLSFPELSIWSPKGGWTQVECLDPAHYLAHKVLTGDSSDHIKGVLTPSQAALALAAPTSPYYNRYTTPQIDKLLLNRQLIDMDYVPRVIQDRVIEQLGSLPDTSIPSNFRPKAVQLGLCCINNGLREQRPPVFCSRSCILKTIETKGLDVLRARIRDNCLDLIKLIQWNAQNGIRVFRISSDLCPHKSNPKAPDYDLDFVQPLLDRAGQLARRYKQRLTFHPGQYNVVGTPHEETFQKTCLDLAYHAELLDRMGCDQDSVMVVHGGGMYGDKPATIKRWIANYQRLPSAVRRRLVLENCEKCFHIEDCLEVSRATGIPVVFDTHHYECYNLMHPAQSPPLQAPEHYIPAILESWNKRSIKPKFHVSEQDPDGKTGKHSFLIQTLPSYLLNLPQPIDIMIEAKGKEEAIYHLYSLYPDLDPRDPSSPLRQFSIKLCLKAPEPPAEATPLQLKRPTLQLKRPTLQLKRPTLQLKRPTLQLKRP